MANKETVNPEVVEQESMSQAQEGQETQKDQETQSVVPRSRRKKEEKVKIFVPKLSGKDDPNLLISVNGKNYLLPRGKESAVPPAVAYEFKRSQKAQVKFDETVSSLLGETESEE